MYWFAIQRHQLPDSRQAHWEPFCYLGMNILNATHPHMTAEMIVMDMVTERPLGEATVKIGPENMEFEDFLWHKHMGIMKYVLGGNHFLWVEGQGQQPIKVVKGTSFPIVLWDQQTEITANILSLSDRVEGFSTQAIAGAGLVAYHITDQALRSRTLHRCYWKPIGLVDDILKHKGEWCQPPKAQQIREEIGIPTPHMRLYCASDGEIYGATKDSKAYNLIKRW